MAPSIARDANTPFKALPPTRDPQIPSMQAKGLDKKEACRGSVRVVSSPRAAFGIVAFELLARSALQCYSHIDGEDCSRTAGG